MSVVPATQQELEQMYISFYPGGSGPLGMMAIICRLLEEVAEARGYDTDFRGLLAANGKRPWDNYKNY